MKRTIIAIAGALALAAGAAGANDDKSATGANDPSKGTSSSAATGTGTAGTTAAGNSATGTNTAGTSAASADLPAVGDVKATDPDAMVITIVLQSGDEQKLNVAKDAQITRDGNSASIGQVQPGDNVRASFDPSSHKASKVEVRSKSSKAPDKSKSNDSSKSDDAQKK